MKKIILIIAFVLWQYNTNAELKIHYDFATFHRDNEKKLIEFYYTYPDNSYTAKLDADGMYVGNIKFKLSISKGSQPIDEIVWEAPYKLENKNGNKPQDFYGIQKIYLEAGQYHAKFEAVDVYNAKNQHDSEFDIFVNSIDSNKLYVSDLQIANNIIPKTSNETYPELFYKNQYYVYPNPIREISNERPTLHLYCEIYNAKRILSSEIDIKYVIYDAINNPVLEYEKTKKIVADAIVETISIPLDIYSSGVYYVEINISSKDKKHNISKKNKFFLINTNVEIEKKSYYTEDEAFEMSEFATYGEEKADREFEMFTLVANKSELQSWKKLTDLKAKQRFLYIFWFTRNPDQTSPFNPELFEFRRRIDYVKTYFSYGTEANGWKSDRGKIYVKFGEPDQREQHFATPDTKAYEEWYYSSGVGGGGEFYFVDTFGMGNYILVHSTAYGYARNDNWYNIVTNRTTTTE